MVVDPLVLAVMMVVRENETARKELLQAVAGLDEASRTERWYGDGEWSVRDILVHLFEWQNGYAYALERIARGERHEIPDYDPAAGDDAFNALVVERNRDMDWDAVIAHLEAARVRHEAAVKNLMKRIKAEQFSEGRTARRMSDAASHDRDHLPAIAAWQRGREAQ
ncbi:MAG: DinB family protein [Chloroflexi bacterium]|nr:DinB family protein [Chloroflexota bacterium]